MTEPQPTPDPDVLDWDTTQHGRMAEHATRPEDELATEPYDPGED